MSKFCKLHIFFFLFAADQHDASPVVTPVPTYSKGRGYLLFINNFVKEGGVKKREGKVIIHDCITCWVFDHCTYRDCMCWSGGYVSQKINYSEYLLIWIW